MGYLGNTPTNTPLTGADITDDSIESADIKAGTIVNSDINASAAIAMTKLAVDPTDASNITSGTLPAGRYTGGGDSLASGMIRTNGLTISDDITFVGDENGVTYGPITIANTKTVTVTSPSVWHIL